jgi:type II secretory ATPase GspE/PulE/Tfp pilus assembly ATPase PilB-like protein
MGVESYKIAAALVGVIAQRLVRTVCPHCKTPYYPPAELLQTLDYQGDTRRQFIRGEGCHECHDTGCKGRVGLYELMWSSSEMRDLIARDVDLETLRRCHLSQGGTTIFREGIRVAENGQASLEEIMRVAFTD